MEFVSEMRELARGLFAGRYERETGGRDGADARVLVCGEELSVPVSLVHHQRLDALWNEDFKHLVRHAILGEAAPGLSFEDTVRRLVDCRRLGFSDGAQAVNYVTSHDVEGMRNERLYNLLHNNGKVHTEERIKLAVACLLTAVGIPMILAGENTILTSATQPSRWTRSTSAGCRTSGASECSPTSPDWSACGCARTHCR